MGVIFGTPYYITTKYLLSFADLFEQLHSGLSEELNNREEETIGFINSKLIKCQGKKASLIDILIEGSNIEKCILQDSDLLYSAFENTNINDLDLSGSSLRALTMSETRTSGVKCERCDFLHAKIEPEILSNWDLLKAINIKR